MTERIDLVAPHPLGTLTFTDCRIPAAQLVGTEGLRNRYGNLDVFRSTVAAAALGMARRALDETLDYTAERNIYGRTLGELQLVQSKIGEMALGVDRSALMIYRAASAAYPRGGDGLSRKGVTKGYIVEALYRDIRALRIYEGASEVQTTIIARQTIANR